MLNVSEFASIRTAPSLLAWLMCRAGFKGRTSFWGVINVLPGHEHNECDVMFSGNRVHNGTFRILSTINVSVSNNTFACDTPLRGVEVALTLPAGQVYGVRYEEALTLECAYLRSKLMQVL